MIKYARGIISSLYNMHICYNSQGFGVVVEASDGYKNRIIFMKNFTDTESAKEVLMGGQLNTEFDRLDTADDKEKLAIQREHQLKGLTNV